MVLILEIGEIIVMGGVVHLLMKWHASLKV